MTGPEDFIRIWQTSGNLTEVAGRCNCSHQTIASRGAMMIAQGVPLKPLLLPTARTPTLKRWAMQYAPKE